MGVEASGNPARLMFFLGPPPGPKVPDSWSLLCSSCSINGHVFLRDSDSTFLSLRLLLVLLHPSPVLLPLGTSSFIHPVLPTPTAVTLIQAPRRLALASLHSNPLQTLPPNNPLNTALTTALYCSDTSHGSPLPTLRATGTADIQSLQKPATRSYLWLPCPLKLCPSLPSITLLPLLRPPAGGFCQRESYSAPAGLSPASALPESVSSGPPLCALRYARPAFQPFLC